MPNDQNFDGQNPVPGYTLFHGKDGKSYYLKGENLADDDITQRVQKLRGAASTDTGTAATQQGNKGPSTYDKLTNPISPDLDAFSQQHPILGVPARIASGAGAAVIGAPAALYNTIRHPIDTAQGIGQSLAAWTDPNTWKGAGSVLPEALGMGAGNYLAGEGVKASSPLVKSGISAVADTGIGQSVSDVAARAKNAAGTALRTESGTPTPIAKNVARGGLALAGHYLGLPPGLGELGGFIAGPSLADALIPKRPFDVPTKGMEPGALLPSADEFYENRGTALMKRLDAPPAPAELGTPENPGWVVKLPGRMPLKKALVPSTSSELATTGDDAQFSPNDLISRTKRVVLPGEEPTPADLKRAGDLTQAPLPRLKSLAKFGDRLAQNEINRRLQNP